MRKEKGRYTVFSNNIPKQFIVLMPSVRTIIELAAKSAAIIFL